MEHLSIKNILKNYNNVESGLNLKQLSKKFMKIKNMSPLKLIEYPDFVQNKDDMYHHVVNKKKEILLLQKN